VRGQRAAASRGSEAAAGTTPIPAGSEAAVLSQLLSQLESECDSASASLAACEAALQRIDYGDVEADEAVAACGAAASAALASVARLSVRLDEVEIGGVTCERAREEARIRRKALRTSLEAEVGPTADRLRAALAHARRRVE
jgi:1-aminocyclopropane-1-carboxylate deaminase/D-cysteine desulfhydrase-like pyridoxal-dependent ACC family enzyme